MGILTDEDVQELLANGREQKAARERGEVIDHKPVVRIFAVMSDAYWLISEINPDKPDEAFGLAELRSGQAEMGDIYISELDELYKSHPVPPIERDNFWTADLTLSGYWFARKNGLRGKNP